MSGAVTRTLAIGALPYTLVFKFGTMRIAEDEMGGKSVFAALSEGLSAGAISAIFWAALQPSHRITREASDNLIDVFGAKALIVELSSALAAYFGTGEAAAAAGNVPDPGPATPKPKPKGKARPAS